MVRIEKILTKLQTALAVWSASKIKAINKLTLWDILLEPERYAGIAEGLQQMPLPDKIKIGRKYYEIPQTLEDFSANICYGQRQFFATQEDIDVGIILRYVAGYYYPIVKKCIWDEKKVLSFYKKVLYSSAKELYPVAIKLLNLMGELAEREKTLLQRNPTKEEQSAGIEKLNRFANLTSLLFLQESFRITEDDVMLKPYDDCLVRFLLAKEQNAYTERLQEVYRNKHSHVKK